MSTSQLKCVRKLFKTTEEKKSFERIRDKKKKNSASFHQPKCKKPPNYTNRDFASVVGKINPDHTALILPNKA